MTVEDISQISPFPALLSQFLSETSFSLARTIPSFVSLFLGNMLSLSFLVLSVLLPWSVTYLPLRGVAREIARTRPYSRSILGQKEDLTGGKINGHLKIPAPKDPNEVAIVLIPIFLFLRNCLPFVSTFVAQN